ncbi:hypothetical protein AZI86_11180 [Bdellovibrio bacteriovorus]|uniref:NAD-dependent epimerase/dehydratase domain-containing protein n=1 Tax=Bdellovibrio bacteriovorus TaxID=959 RepID=A0A150WLJ7_BDEBC|nr:NAD-dependent epimerase/dehydratase family protein [Bdellovibrio bacteriovorus]KYG64762.1 hypothetical protein AZI86_11180 [Bdellovibrio bacteriovorus]
MSLSREFWQGKRVFVTSPTSFLGAWTCLSLTYLGAQVFGFGEASSEALSLFDVSGLAQKISMTYADIRDEKSLSDTLNFAQSDIVLHLGELGFLFEEDRKSPELIAKSVVGTANLLELLRETASVRALVVASSDKVYARPAVVPSVEDSALGAYEILPTARLCSELVTLSYRHSFFNPDKYNKHKIALATARLGAGVGGGDFALKSFMREAVESVRGGGPMVLRHPSSMRSWIHVLDQVRGLLLLAEKLLERGPKLAPTYNLGSNSMATVGDALELIKRSWMGSVEGVALSSKATSVHGTMNSDLALQDLGWQPVLSVEESIKAAVTWYRAYFNGTSEEEILRQLKLHL